MMVRVEKNDKVGTVSFNYKTKELIVDFPDAVIKRQIEKYFNTELEFYIPESPIIDDYRKDVVKPVSGLIYMELALVEINAREGVWVDWESMTGGTDDVDLDEVKRVEGYT